MVHIRDRFRNQWFFLIGALLTLAAIFAYQILQSHDSIERQEEAHLANLANVSADIIERHLAISDALLADLLSNPIKATDNNRYKEALKIYNQSIDNKTENVETSDNRVNSLID